MLAAVFIAFLIFSIFDAFIMYLIFIAQPMDDDDDDYDLAFQPQIQSNIPEFVYDSNSNKLVPKLSRKD